MSVSGEGDRFNASIGRLDKVVACLSVCGVLGHERSWHGALRLAWLVGKGLGRGRVCLFCWWGTEWSGPNVCWAGSGGC